LTYFLLYQVDVVERAIEDLHSYLRRRMTDLRKTSMLLRNRRMLNHRQVSLLTHALQNLDEHPRYTIKEHQSSNDIAYETARQDLMELEAQGLLDAIKEGRTSVFFPPLDFADRLADSDE